MEKRCPVNFGIDWTEFWTSCVVAKYLNFGAKKRLEHQGTLYSVCAWLVFML